MKKRNVMILVILLVIGFASVSTSLILNGTIGIGTNEDDFDVIFVEALLDGKENSKAIISEDKKTITFSTDKFINKGDSARLVYKVKNTSTQYNADVTINCTNENSEYVAIESFFDENSLPLENPINMQAQEMKNGYINAKLIKAYAGEDDSIKISCSIDFAATSRETYVYSLSFDSNGGSKIDDKSIVLNDSYGELTTPEREGYTFLGWYDEEDNKVDSSTVFDTKGNRNLYAKWEEICDIANPLVKELNKWLWKDNDCSRNISNGDLITLGTESFYVYNTNGNNIKAIAQYNLEVGNHVNSSSPAASETNIQSSRALGQKSGVTTYASVQFSSTNNSYAGSIVANYASNYVNILKSKYGVELTGRLITREELLALGCSSTSCLSAPSYIYFTSYWTSSALAGNSGSVWSVDSNGVFDYHSCFSGRNYGVRPIIEVSKTLLQ